MPHPACHPSGQSDLDSSSTEPSSQVALGHKKLKVNGYLGLNLTASVLFSMGQTSPGDFNLMSLHFPYILLSQSLTVFCSNLGSYFCGVQLFAASWFEFFVGMCFKFLLHHCFTLPFNLAF